MQKLKRASKIVTQNQYNIYKKKCEDCGKALKIKSLENLDNAVVICDECGYSRGFTSHEIDWEKKHLEEVQK